MVVEDCEFGNIEVKSDGRIRRYGLKIVGGVLQMQMPGYGDMQSLLLFLDKNREWVREKLKRAKVKKVLLYGPDYVFQSFAFTILWKEYGRQRIVGSLNLDEKKLTIYFPNGCDLYSVKSQSTIKSIIENALMVAAKKILPSWLMDVSRRIGIPHKECQIRKMHSRWGSCSSAASVHLSCMLLLLPAELIEFVMIHELCHIKEMNHGPNFHRLVNQLLDGKEKYYEEEIKKYSTKL